MNIKGYITYQAGQLQAQECFVLTEGQQEFKDFTVQVKWLKANHGKHLQLSIDSHQTIVLKAVELLLPYSFQEEDQLFLQATGQQKFPIFAKSDMEFALKVVKASVIFEANDTGEIVKLTLNQGGVLQPAPKL